MKWLEKIKKSENINQLPTYKELINYTEADWKEYFKNDKFYSRVIKEFNITIEDIKRFKEDVIQHALNKEKSKELYDELIKLTSKYDSDRYCRFIDEHREEVYDELEYEDRFMLLKNLYIGAKDCKEIGYMLKEEVLDFGDIIPDLEVENIKKVFNGKEKIKAYRGINNYNLKNGCSYTLDKSKAEWFANRYGDIGYVIEKEITVDDILFYNDSRKEQEVFLR